MTSPETSSDAQLGATFKTELGNGVQNSGSGNVHVGGSIHFGASAAIIAEAFDIILNHRFARGEILKNSQTNDDGPNPGGKSSEEDCSAKHLRLVTNSGEEEIWQSESSNKHAAHGLVSEEDLTVCHDVKQTDNQSDELTEQHAQKTLAIDIKAFWNTRLSSGYEKTFVARRKKTSRCATSYWCPRNPNWMCRRGPSWIGCILGPWNMRPNAFSSNFRCRCSKELILGEQQPTQQSWVKSFFRRSSGGLSYALRPIRVLPLDHPFWFYVGVREELLLNALDNGLVVFPDDRRDDGYEALEIVISFYYWGGRHLDRLLDQWEHLLPQLTFSRRISYALRRTWDKADKSVAQPLMRIAPYIDGWDEPESRLYAAVASDDVTEVKNALEELDDISTIDDLGPKGYASIHIAAMSGGDQILRMLMGAGADINRRDYQGKTPLMVATEYWSASCMQTLITHGCRINDQTDIGFTALDFAAKHCNGDAISLLLREGAFALHTNLRGETAIHHLCKSSNFTPEPGLLSLITTIGVDHEDYRGYTPLVYALIENRYDTIDCLIASGASLKFADRKNILHYAAAYSNSGMLMNLYCLKLSAKDGVDVEAKDDDGNTVWDTFLTSLYGGEFWGGDSWDAPYRRLVDYGERMRFLEVFEGVRDRNLQHDIANLQQALGALDTNDIPSSCFQLCTLSKQKAYCNNEDAALLYQGFQYEIEAGDVESARLKIKDQLNCLTKKLKSSPWKELGPWSQKYLDERDYIATLTVADEFA